MKFHSFQIIHNFSRLDSELTCISLFLSLVYFGCVCVCVYVYANCCVGV